MMASFDSRYDTTLEGLMMNVFIFFLFFMQGLSTLFPHFVASCVHSFCFHTGEGALMARLG